LGSTTEGNEHYGELLKIFNQEFEQEITAELKPTIEEKRAADSMYYSNLCEELEDLERRVKMQSQLLQQVWSEVDEKEMLKNGMKDKSQPLDHFDWLIEEIRSLMVR
jgi:alcohol dehydrogenase class IV